MDRKDELRHKILLTASLVVLSAIVIVLVLRFRDNTLAEFTYEEVDGGIVVKGYQGDPTTLEVPETIDGKTVVAIGESAFAAQKRLREVILPGTVTTIEEAAFADCESLESVEAPGVTVIRTEAFQGCAELKEASFSHQLTVVEDRAFQGCGKFRSLVAPATLTEIGTDAFAGCGNLHLDVTANPLAAEVALQYGLSTDGSDTSDGMWLRIAGATLLLGAFVALIWMIVAKTARSKRGRAPLPTARGSGEEK